MRKTFQILLGLAGTAMLYSCQANEIKIPAEEQFMREFIKNYGTIDSSQDWSVIKKGEITVSSSTGDPVKIFAVVDGKARILAFAPGLKGSETVTFDLPKEIDEVYVQSGAYLNNVPLGGSVTIGPASRAIDGSDNLNYDDHISVAWDYEHVEAFRNVLPEYERWPGESDPERKKCGLGNPRIVTDFSFISDGNPFVFYPMYWNTTATNTLGIYWYEDGQIHTKDIFTNHLADRDPKLHNMYRKPRRELDDLRISATRPGTSATNQDLTGEITLYLSRPFRSTDGLSVTLTNTVTDATVALTPKTTDDNELDHEGKRIKTFPYSGLDANTIYKVTVAEGSFEAADGKSDGYAKNLNPAYEYYFSTKTPLCFVSSTIKDENEPLTARTGTIKVTYSVNIKLDGTVQPTIRQTDATESGDEKITAATVNGKILSISYEAPLKETKYSISIPAGYVMSADGKEVIGKEEVLNFTTVGVIRTPTAYAEQAIPCPFSIADGTTATTEGMTLYTDSYITVTATHAGGKIQALMNGDAGGWEYSIYGNETKTAFNKGVWSNIADSKLNPFETAPPQDLTYLKVIPAVDMILTSHTASEGASGRRHIYLNSRVNPISTESMGTVSDFTLGSSSPKTMNLFNDSWELQAGKTYILYGRSKDTAFAGISYRVATEYDEKDATPQWAPLRPARTPSRAGTEGSVEDTRQTFSSDAEIEGAGYSRLTTVGNNKSSLQNYEDKYGSGMDDIATKRISVTLPAGRIFGFYVRNNNGAAGYCDGIKYHNYSMSDLNKTLANSFFSQCKTVTDGTETYDFTKGWKKQDKINTDILEGREYSTAATYEVDIDGETYRYFSFEDWVDCDFNDIVFMVAPGQKTEVIDMELDTNPYIYAVEDLGGVTDASDIDFNDVVFGVEYIRSTNAVDNCLFVTMLAAGGTLETQLYFNGNPVNGSDDYGQAIVHGPFEGTGHLLRHVNEWFNETDTRPIINVGGEGVSYPFGELTTVRIKVPVDFSLSDLEADKDDGRIGGFHVVVKRDGESNRVTRPSATGEAPQMLILPGKWRWPQEKKAIHLAYPGGYDGEGNPVSSFESWVSDYIGHTDWHQSYTESLVVRHPWEGSLAAREHLRRLKEEGTAVE